MPTQRNLLQNFNQVSNSANNKKLKTISLSNALKQMKMENDSKKVRKRLQFHSNSNSNSNKKSKSLSPLPFKMPKRNYHKTTVPNVIVQNKNRKKGGILNSLPNKFFRSNSNSNSNSNVSLRKVLDEFLNLQKKLKSLKPKNDGTVSNNQKRVITKMKNLLIKNNNKK